MSTSSVAIVPLFARGLHVLLVDTDVTNLLYMKVLLQMNSYKVTMLYSSPTALSKILERKYNYDIVIAELEMPEIDGFKFLQLIRRHVEIPVILMGSDIEIDMVERALNLGACYFLQKPIGVDDLTGIWHHVMCKRLELSNSTGQIERYSGFGNAVLESSDQAETEESDQFDESDADREISVLKRVGANGRIVWTPQLHRKFRAAISELGEADAKPLRILRAMNVPNLTLRHVASHLQKYRRRTRGRGVMTQNPPILDSMSRMQTQNVHNGQSQVSPILSSSMEGQNTHVENSSVLPQQDFIYGQRRELRNSPYLSNSMEGQSAAVSTQAFSNAQCQKHWDSPYLSASMGGQNAPSVMPTQHFNNGQLQILWDSPSSSNNMEGQNTSSVRPTQDSYNGQRLWYSPYLSNSIGGQNTNVRSPSAMPTQNFRDGQRQELWNSPYLSNSTTGQNASSVVPTQEFNGQPQNLWDYPYLSNSMGGQNTSSVMPIQDFSNGCGLSDSPYLSNTMGGQNNNVRNSSVMPAQNVKCEQHQKLGGSSLSNSIAGLNTKVTNSLTTPAQSSNYGQHQTLSDSPNSSVYTGGPSSNLRNSMIVPAQNFQNGQNQKLGDSPNLLPTQSFSFAQRPGLFDMPNWNCRGGLNTNSSAYLSQPNVGSSAGYDSKTYLKILENCNSSNTNSDQTVQADVAQTNIQEESTHNPRSVQLADGVAEMNLVTESTIANKRLSASEKGKGILHLDSYGGWVDHTGIHLTSELVDSLQESSADNSATVIADALKCMMRGNNSQDLDHVLDCMMKENDYEDIQVQEFSPAWEGLALDTDIMNDVTKPKSMEGSDVPNMEPNIFEGSDAPSMKRKSMEGLYVPDMETKTVARSDVPSCSKTQEQEPWGIDNMMELLREDENFKEWQKLPPNAKFGFIE